MKLTLEEQAWLDAYRQALAEQFPDLVEEIVIFGSKARGEAGPDSDLDVLLIVRNDASH
ncbi:MAG: nucleotidyltransferase domain-containing protein, partial [Acidobacteriota bacterium]